ncbi:N-acylneuraminate cytidylyltransferase [Halorubrum distributum JCM 13561]|uniref:N-acylneuraminate cytidylyltransferase n=1 Tax=Halorubrum distributum JCM 13561 TaxID=1227483 RepID=M0NVJ8_9EURY|nr:acylneuraminate cytidylyltransferase family protein [Halorubrum litoreum]EMA61289.1 N-acylneuraminate cytidylyltransferase [Halorubrum litoreum JCM 13561]
MTDEKVLGLIPARSGSKGVPDKNIRDVDGKPLIAHSIAAGQNASSIDTVVVSTDDDAIATVAERYGARVPFIRPDHLATDEAPTAPVIKHAVEYLRKQGEEYDTFVLLQPTSPLRTEEHIDEAHSQYDRSDVDSLISAYPTYDTRWQQTPEGAEKLNYVDADKRRQDRDPEYVINGAVYVTDVAEFMETENIITGKTGIYEMSERESVDIDTPFDLWLAEQILSRWEDQ